MNFIKRCLFLVALLFKVYVSNAQVNLQLNNDLNLSQGLIFGQPVNLYDILVASDRLKSDSTIEMISHANELTASLLHHPIFDHIETVLNDEDVLVLYTLFISDKQKTDQYREKIISSLTKYYGLAASTKDSWLFRKGDEYARFIINPKGNCELSVGTDKYIHAIESFDKKEKLTFIYTKGHLFNHNDPGLANGQDTSYFDSFIINFTGIKETKTIRLYMAAEHNDIKEISLLMNGGETIRLKPDKKSRSKPYYFYEFNLSRQITDKLFKQNHITISFKGKSPNKVDIPYESLTDFNLIYKYLYLK
jgi:hypothetical protein